MNTAVKSEPPLPRIVSNPSGVTPKNPAKQTTLPASTEFVRVLSRLLLSSKFGVASSKLSSVTIGQFSRGKQ